MFNILLNTKFNLNDSTIWLALLSVLIGSFFLGYCWNDKFYRSFGFWFLGMSNGLFVLAALEVIVK